MKLLGLDHIAVVVRDIDDTIARAGDTVDPLVAVPFCVALAVTLLSTRRPRIVAE